MKNNREKKNIIEYIYKKYNKSLRSYLFVRLRSTNDIDDLMQQLYFKVWTYDKAVEIKDIKNFIFTAALNLIRDRSRRVVTRATTQFVEISESHITYDIDPMNDAMHKEQLKILWEKFNLLHPDQRDTILMNKLNGVYNHDIAKMLGVSISATEKNSMNGINKLKRAIN